MHNVAATLKIGCERKRERETGIKSMKKDKNKTFLQPLEMEILLSVGKHFWVSAL